jgi:hypothetical protein
VFSCQAKEGAVQRRTKRGRRRKMGEVPFGRITLAIEKISRLDNGWIMGIMGTHPNFWRIMGTHPNFSS